MGDFVNGVTLQPLSVRAIFVSAAIVVCFLLMLPKFGRNWYARIEQILSAFAERRVLAASAVFLAVIAIRLALLPVLPVPVPGIADEYSYLLAGDTFAHGRLTNPTHPLWVSFETFHVNWLPTYSSMYPPAQGFVLAVGQWLGHPWIGVLLSNAAMCVAILWMLQAWLPARWALLGTAMAALNLSFTNYWMNSYWGGAVAAIGGALVLGSLPRIARRANVRHALLLALGIALLANSRPYEGVFFALPAVVWLILWLAGRIPSQDSASVRIRRVLVPLCTVLILTISFMGYYNLRLTGDPLLLPHELNHRTYYTGPFFLWQDARPQLHYRNMPFHVLYNGLERATYRTTWPDAVKVSKQKLDRYQKNFFWPGVQFVLPALPFIFLDRKMRMLLITLGTTALAIFAVVWAHPHYGAALTCVLYALLVQALRHLRTMRTRSLPFGIILSRAVVVLLISNTAMRAAQGISGPVFYPHHGNEERAMLAEQLSRQSRKQLVIVRYAKLHDPNYEWVYNGADIDGGKVVWAREMDPEQNAKLLAHFKDREVWTIEPDHDPRQLNPYLPSAETAKR